MVAIERIGVQGPETTVKATALGLAQTFEKNKGWEAEAQERATEAATAILDSMKATADPQLRKSARTSTLGKEGE
jgi:hypothetical protein